MRYEINCRKCGKKKIGYVVSQSRRHGVKLMCDCGFETNWINAKHLKEMKQ